MISNQNLKKIFEKTLGHCHFCGDKIIFQKYSSKYLNEQGAWEIDHICQIKKGGKSEEQNYLPACIPCNRLRWHRKGDEIRELLLLGLISKDLIKKNTKIGIKIQNLKMKRLEQNMKRRRDL